MEKSFSDSAFLAEGIIENCQRKNEIEDAFVIVEDTGEAEIRYANNGITTNGERLDRTITLAVTTSKHGRQSIGLQSISTLSVAEAVHDLIDEALMSAKLAEPLGVKETPLLPGELIEVSTDAKNALSKDDFYLSPESVESGIFKEALSELSSVFSSALKVKDLVSGFLSYEVTTTYLASSTGIRFRGAEQLGTFELVKRRRRPDRVTSVWDGKITKDFKDISPLAVNENLSQKLALSEKRVELPPGRYEVIMPPSAVADLMIELYSAADARDVFEGGTVFSVPKGGSFSSQRIGQSGFSLFSDPYDIHLPCNETFVATSNGSDTSIFDNGVELHKTYWLKDAMVENLRCSRAEASKYGISPAFHIGNLVLETDRETTELQDMIKKTKKGLLITCLWYIREVDRSKLLLTGLTRDGVYLVENGEIVAEVNNFRFNDSPITLLNNATEVSQSTTCYPRESGEWMPMCRMPAMKVSEFNFDSISPAN